MRKLVVLLVVALLVLTAGCSLFDSSGDRESDGIEADGDVELLPGLTTDGVTDRIALADTHYGALENESYRLENQLTARDENGSIVSVQERTQTVTPDAAAGTVEIDPEYVDELSNAVVTSESWTDGDAEYTRQIDESGNVTYYPQSYYITSEPGLPVSILALFESVEDVSVEGHGGAERYRLEGSGPVPFAEEASFDLWFSPDGYVEEYRIDLRQSTDGGLLQVEHVGQFERADDARYFERNHVGYYEERTEIELEEPDWLEEVEAELEDR